MENRKSDSKPFEMPTKYPICNSDLVRRETSYYCINDSIEGSEDIFELLVDGIYTLEYIDFDIFDVSNSIVTTIYNEYELAYREFVYNNYLQIPETTKQTILNHIKLGKLDKNSDTIIEDVVNYIKRICEYKFTEYPEGVDNVVYFLDVSNEGICQQFASAATLMFRALGIPARYTIGFVSPSKENVSVDVSACNYHAWVEVYIDGLGWVIVEATPSGDNGSVRPDLPLDPGNPDNPGDPDNPDNPDNPDDPEEKHTLNIKPIDRVKEYDGYLLFPYRMEDISNGIVSSIIEGFDEETKVLLQKLIDKGYKFEVLTFGEQREVGQSNSTIGKIVIYNENNE